VVGLDSGVVGAAILAGVGCGMFRSIADAAASLVRRDRTFEPDAARTAIHEEGFARYMDLYGRLRGYAASQPLAAAGFTNDGRI
jgi:sugar (pentulose or hexulose) kinase